MELKLQTRSLEGKIAREEFQRLTRNFQMCGPTDISNANPGGL
jgi:hypothetical protein